MTPIRARPTANRKPVKMNGTVDGNTTDLKICQSEAPKLLAAVRRLCGVVFTPSRVLINKGKRAPRKMIPTLERMPMPSQIMTRGKRAIRGVAFMALTNGSQMYENRLYQPIAIPKGIATTTESRYPQKNSMPLTYKSLRSPPKQTSERPL